LHIAFNRMTIYSCIF